MTYSNINRGVSAAWLLLAATLWMAAPSRSFAHDGDPWAEKPATGEDAAKEHSKRVRSEIARYEAEIAEIEADEAKLKSRLKEHEKAPNDSAVNVDDVKLSLAQLGEAKAKFEAKVTQLRAMLGAVALGRVKAMETEERNLRVQESRLQAIAAEIAAQHAKKTRELPPLKNAEIKVFSLAYAAPEDLAKVIDSIFSPAQLRLSIDDRTKSLVVMGDKESLGIVEALLAKMDQPADGAADSLVQEGAKPQAAGDRSLLLRVFWLADGLPADEGQDPAAYLPKSVLKALDGLGLKAPRLVTQTVNSLAVGTTDKINFGTRVPAVLGSQPATLELSGSMRPIVDERARLEMRILASGNIQLEGSLATPLGDYMVLGTVNSLSLDPATAGMTMPAGGYGMEGGIGPEGGFVGESTAIVDPATAAQQAPQPKFNEARFAFVVQVVEATSYAAEESE